MDAFSSTYTVSDEASHFPTRSTGSNGCKCVDSPTSSQGSTSEVQQQITAYSNKLKSVDSQRSRKSSTSEAKQITACKRLSRKTTSSWTLHSATLSDDGYAWRKFGQKTILNAQYPRNYFRCAHKYDQGCQATKQVQRIAEDPPMYRTTYYMHHTCKIPNDAVDQLKSQPFMSDPPDAADNVREARGNALPSSFPPMTQEHKKDDIGYQESHTQASSTSCAPSPVLSAFNLSDGSSVDSDDSSDGVLHFQF